MVYFANDDAIQTSEESNLNVAVVLIIFYAGYNSFFCILVYYEIPYTHHSLHSLIPIAGMEGEKENTSKKTDTSHKK